MGEWVEMMNCDPLLTRRYMETISRMMPFGERAASGSSRMYSPSLRAQKKTVFRAQIPPHERKILPKIGMRAAGMKIKVARAALGVEPERDGDRLDQRGFADAVFSHEKSNALAEGQLPHLCKIFYDGKVPDVILVRDSAFEFDPFDIEGRIFHKPFTIRWERAGALLSTNLRKILHTASSFRSRRRSGADCSVPKTPLRIFRSFPR